MIKIGILQKKPNRKQGASVTSLYELVDKGYKIILTLFWHFTALLPSSASTPGQLLMSRVNTTSRRMSSRRSISSSIVYTSSSSNDPARRRSYRPARAGRTSAVQSHSARLFRSACNFRSAARSCS